MNSYFDRIATSQNAAELIALVNEFISCTREHGGFENLPTAARPRRLYSFPGLVQSREAIAKVVERQPKTAMDGAAVVALAVLDAALVRFRTLVRELDVPVHHWRMG